jgi:hypothetical protein
MGGLRIEAFDERRQEISRFQNTQALSGLASRTRRPL